MSGKVAKPLALIVPFFLLASSAALAQKAKRTDVTYDELFQHYLEEARQPGAGRPEPDRWAWMTALPLDRRARAVNDLLSIRVVENITGSGTADAALSKKSQSAIAVPKFFGLETLLPKAVDPTALITSNGNTDFKGSGTTTRAGELTALMTARVADVLPNGDLVVEGVREIEINGDQQIVVLTGVVRATDVGPNNLVLSTSIGQLRIRYFGRGLIRDNLQPGWLIRILNKVF
jgi:flagellar L-ring protein precursor FlgH